MKKIENPKSGLQITRKLSAKNERAFILQIIKDFNLCGVMHTIPDSNIAAVISTVHTIIAELLLSDPERVRTLLYRVDVKEESIVDLYNESTSIEAMAVQITMLIVNRELAKVANRDKFK